MFRTGAYVTEPKFPAILGYEAAGTVEKLGPGYQLFEITKDPERLERAKRFIVDGLAKGVLKPKIAKTFKFDDIVEAYRFMESNEQIGKIVVTI